MKLGTALFRLTTVHGNAPLCRQGWKYGILAVNSA